MAGKGREDVIRERVRALELQLARRNDLLARLRSSVRSMVAGPAREEAVRLVDALGPKPSIEKVEAALRGQEAMNRGGPSPGRKTSAGGPVPTNEEKTRAVVEPPLQRLVAGRYELERKLGSGGFGDVFLAHDKTLGRPVVVKSLHPHLGGSAAFRENIVREARIAAKIQHANVVTVFDAPEENGVVHIVMEFVDGTPLSDLLIRMKRFPVRDALLLTYECTKGLAAIHEHGFLHRDIKPANILLTKAGLPKLVDLGIAKHWGESSGLSLTTVQPGTVAFMSPEQARGSRDIDERSDIYSLTLVLFVMVTGTNVYDFEGLTEVERRLKVVQEEIQWSGVDKRYPAPLVALLKKGLAKDPRNRFSSASAFGSALLQTLKALPKA